MSPGDVLDQLLRLRFPRVSGDEPPSIRLLPADHRFSPRERG